MISRSREVLHAVFGVLLVLAIVGWVLNVLDWTYRLTTGGWNELEGHLLHVMAVTFGIEYATLPYALLFECVFLLVTIALIVGFVRTRSDTKGATGPRQSDAEGVHS